MAGKRGKKRSLTESTGTGRGRGRPSKKRATTTHPHGTSVDYDKDYKVRSIIGENANQFHIDWEPDEETGEVYEPTWEPKENANELAVQDWERRKAADKQRPASGSGSAAPVRRRGRPRKVIVESSPPAEPQETQGDTATTAADQPVELATTEPEAETTAGAAEIEESQQIEDGEPLQGNDEEGLFVAPSSPPSSYLAGAYQKAVGEESRALQTTTSSASGIPQSTAPAAASTQKSTNSTSLVIPDSQSQGAFIDQSTFRGFSPTQYTQQTQVEPADEDTTQQSLNLGADGLQHHTDAVEQSSLLATEATELSQPASVSDHPKDHLSDGDQIDSASNNDTEAPHAVQDPIVTATSQSTEEEQVNLGIASGPPTQLTTDLTVEPSAGSASAEEPKKSTFVLDTTATADIVSNGDPSTQSSHPLRQPNGERQVIVLSSVEVQSGQSASLDFDSSIDDTDFEPPPAAQRPVPSSALDDIFAVPNPERSQVSAVEPLTQQQTTSQSETVETPLGLTQSQNPPTRTIHYYGSSQSFPFQTQINQQTTPQKFESPLDYTYTPGSRALLMPKAGSEHRSPSVLSSRSPDSTPFPSLPRGVVGAIGESAPPRLSLSSRGQLTMESSPIPKRETLAEKMKRSREARNAARASATPVPSVTSSLANGNLEHTQPASALPPNLIAEVAVAQAVRLGSPLLSMHERSPSAIPAVEEVAPITREEMTTSERYETLLPQAQSQNSSDVGPQQNGISIITKPVNRPQDEMEDPEAASVHVVPVAPSAFQRDHYRNTIYYEEKLIAQVLDTENVLDDRILAKTNEFLEKLRKVALHPDLVNPETLSQVSENEIQAMWDIKTSAKFEFLNQFIAHVSDQNLHIAVVAHGVRIPSMLYNFFQGIKVPCKRWAHPLSIDPDLSPANLGIKVSIVDLDGGPHNVEPADVVIAMDPSVDYRHPLVRAVRKGSSKWSLLLTLVIPHTLEHIERSLQADLPPLTLTRTLVKATNDFRRYAGRLESTQAPLKDAASAVADYLDDTSAEWPIAGLSQLEDMDSQTESDIQVDSHGTKRPLDDADAEIADEHKRARLGSSAGPQLPGTVNPLELDITHVSDSLHKGTQSNTDTGNPSILSSDTERRLREVLQGVQDRLEEHVKALENLQYRHEDQRKSLVETKKERDTALLAAATAQARMTGAEANNAALRVERTQLKEALAEVNARLLSHDVPEIRELEEVRVAAQAAKIEEEKAKKKAAAAEKDLEWTRSMYQDSSNRARELAQNNSELEASLAHVSQIAQGEQARAREISRQGHNKALEQDNLRLRMTLENMKLAMKNKDEQITTLKEGRGRMGTRGSSVPRSPRMGSPMKGRVSRQASPAAADVRGRAAHLHPLRNSAGSTAE